MVLSGLGLKPTWSASRVPPVKRDQPKHTVRKETSSKPRDPPVKRDQPTTNFFWFQRTQSPNKGTQAQFADFTPTPPRGSRGKEFTYCQ